MDRLVEDDRADLVNTWEEVVQLAGPQAKLTQRVHCQNEGWCRESPSSGGHEEKWDQWFDEAFRQSVPSSGS